MFIDRSCKTCEFNFSGTCASHDGFKKYGWEIDDFNIQRECWKISLPYSIELAKLLPDNEREAYENSIDAEINDLIVRLETGKWQKLN